MLLCVTKLSSGSLSARRATHGVTLGPSTVREFGIENVDGACGISWTLGALGVLFAEISCAEGMRTRMVSLKSESACSTGRGSSSASESGR